MTVIQNFYITNCWEDELHVKNQLWNRNSYLRWVSTCISISIARINQEGNNKDEIRSRFIWYLQNKKNINLLAKEKKNLISTGNLFLPYFEGHDYAILPGSEQSVLYYNHVPSCLQEYPFLVPLDGQKVQKKLEYTFINKTVFRWLHVHGPKHKS